ncbi:hypothetical protein LCGC14_1541930, partial [marine sediment metagenome]
MSELSNRIWLIAVKDKTTGVVLQGTLEADSEIEARDKITLTLERMFLGAQRVDFDRVPEGLLAVFQAMHETIQLNDLSIAGYHIGGVEEG